MERQDIFVHLDHPRVYLEEDFHQKILEKFEDEMKRAMDKANNPILIQGSASGKLSEEFPIERTVCSALGTRINRDKYTQIDDGAISSDYWNRYTSMLIEGAEKRFWGALARECVLMACEQTYLWEHEGKALFSPYEGIELFEGENVHRMIPREYRREKSALRKSRKMEKSNYRYGTVLASPFFGLVNLMHRDKQLANHWFLGKFFNPNIIDQLSDIETHILFN